ncbi:hypothetical protein NA57DRAFT_54631 [Rhizodiscina lignyota]|uniref:Uncharacterized protein n=1 Tax=Rhizodiscina lignyota TaxID=1504668 RepID=A0A9P4IJS7_9PEZI|nr:hypothetical protein NA57DRAFT_54631 [Rhizodiscina lignyota]
MCGALARPDICTPTRITPSELIFVGSWVTLPADETFDFDSTDSWIRSDNDEIARGAEKDENARDCSAKFMVNTQSAATHTTEDPSTTRPNPTSEDHGAHGSTQQRSIAIQRWLNEQLSEAPLMMFRPSTSTSSHAWEATISDDYPTSSNGYRAASSAQTERQSGKARRKIKAVVTD